MVKKLKTKRYFLTGPNVCDSYIHLSATDKEYPILKLADCQRSVQWYFDSYDLKSTKASLKKIRKVRPAIDTLEEYLEQLIEHYESNPTNE